MEQSVEFLIKSHYAQLRTSEKKDAERVLYGYQLKPQDTMESVPGKVVSGTIAMMEEDALYISDKILHLRIFEDENNKMNLSLLDTKGALMIVSQFTLYGDSRHGRRPSFTEAELPKQASRLYEHVVRSCRIEGIKVETGNFQTHMQVALENDGPVTLLLDSKKLF